MNPLLLSYKGEYSPADYLLVTALDECECERRHTCSLGTSIWTIISSFPAASEQSLANAVISLQGSMKVSMNEAAVIFDQLQ